MTNMYLREMGLPGLVPVGRDLSHKEIVEIGEKFIGVAAGDLSMDALCFLANTP